MSQSTFAVLLDRHPDQQAILRELKQQISMTLSADRNALIDDRILGQQLHVEENVIKDFLIELVNLHGLRAVFLWSCPNTGGGLKEASKLSELPDSIECEHCGQVHYFNVDDVEVLFLPTDRLFGEIVGHPQHEAHRVQQTS